MAGAIQLTEVDFEQIKLNLIDYLRSTKKFTDYDFSGSNLQVVLNLIAYQAQLNAYSTNMIANESFLASASLRDNVVSNAKSLGYVPTSAKSSQTSVTFNLTLTEEDFPSGYPSFVELQPGAVFQTGTGEANYTFNVIDPQSTPVSTGGLVTFSNIPVYEGFYLTQEFILNSANFNQKFVLENQKIDTTTIRVEVQENPNQEARTFFEQANNLVKVSSNSAVYWIEEVNNEYYEITFGDGSFGKALKDGARIFITYLVGSGALANGINAATNFSYDGTIITSQGQALDKQATITSATTTFGGAEIESVRSIKFRAPRAYSAQNRAVTASDYETLIREIYPGVSDIYAYGGEELDIPEYGRVFVAIKPSSGESLSSATKTYIKNSLNDYRVASLQVVIVDPSVLYLEVDTTAFYNDKLTIKDSAGIASDIKHTLSSFVVAGSINKFGGAARYSRIVGAIDDSDTAITRNTTVLRMRRDFQIVANTPASYEVCFEQGIDSTSASAVVYSTGFQIIINKVNDGNTYYFEDDTKGNLWLYYVKADGTKVIVDYRFGTIDYAKGELMIGYTNPVTFVSTVEPKSLIRVRAVPLGQDVIAKKSVYLELDIDNSKISAVVDTNVLSS